MTRLKAIVAALALSAALPGGADAQTAPSPTGAEVAGTWTLRIIPVQRPGVTVKTDKADMPLTITTRPGGRLACSFGDDPADCRVQIRRGALIVTWTTPDAAMTFTLTDRARDGFSGAVRMRPRLLPFGSVHIGAASMFRR